MIAKWSKVYPLQLHRTGFQSQTYSNSTASQICIQFSHRLSIWETQKPKLPLLSMRWVTCTSWPMVTEYAEQHGIPQTALLKQGTSQHDRGNQDLTLYCWSHCALLQCSASRMKFPGVFCQPLAGISHGVPPVWSLPWLFYVGIKEQNKKQSTPGFLLLSPLVMVRGRVYKGNEYWFCNFHWRRDS